MDALTSALVAQSRDGFLEYVVPERGGGDFVLRGSRTEDSPLRAQLLATPDGLPDGAAMWMGEGDDVPVAFVALFSDFDGGYDVVSFSPTSVQRVPLAIVSVDGLTEVSSARAPVTAGGATRGFFVEDAPGATWGIRRTRFSTAVMVKSDGFRLVKARTSRSAIPARDLGFSLGEIYMPARTGTKTCLAWAFRDVEGGNDYAKLSLDGNCLLVEWASRVDSFTREDIAAGLSSAAIQQALEGLV